MHDYTHIRYEVDHAVATITLSRPEALNAINLELMAELLHAVHRVDADTDVRALILTGAGRGFCSGQDLKQRLPQDADIVTALMEAYYPAIAALRQCRVPVTAAVNGLAAGAGFSIALACDFIIAAESARFILAFSRIGLVPDLGASYVLPRAIGRARALQVMMTGDSISAANAENWGLAIKSVPDDQLLESAGEWAQRLAQGPTVALRKMRDLVDAAEHNSFEAHFRQELQTQAVLRVGHDAREGVAAFLEKRPAVFKGR